MTSNRSIKRVLMRGRADNVDVRVSNRRCVVLSSYYDREIGFPTKWSAAQNRARKRRAAAALK